MGFNPSQVWHIASPTNTTDSGSEYNHVYPFSFTTSFSWLCEPSDFLLGTPEPHGRWFLGWYCSICYDLLGSCSTRLKHGLLQMVPASAFCLTVEKHRHFLNTSSLCSLWFIQVQTSFPFYRFFHAKFVHFISVFSLPLWWTSAAAAAITSLAPLYSILSLVQCIWRVSPSNIKFYWIPSFTQLCWETVLLLLESQTTEQLQMQPSSNPPVWISILMF